MPGKMHECLPSLPGYKAQMPLSPGDRRHYKKTTLTYLRGYAMDETPVHADLEPPPELPGAARPSEQPLAAIGTAVDTSKGPKWVQNDKKLLRWYGYFKEAVPESPNENFRVRSVVICYYLADDTTEVLEPRIVNSGLWQGSFIKRHKIPKEDGSPMQPADIRVADNVSVYGRVFRIVDADAFTRAYFTAQGITLAPAEAVPMDPFRQLQAAKAQEQSKEGKQHSQGTAPSGFTQLGRLQAYLLNSKKVLRFYCVWDNRQNLYGDRRPFRLHFYLEDHTTEILEVHEQNPGRDRFPVFLQRCQLPKDPEVTKPGKNIDRKLCFGLEDFRIGTFVRIYSRDFFIHDCDDFTRQWYQGNVGYSPEMMAPVDIREPLPSDRGSTLPPYNGFGTLEDSAQNCRHLVPKPPKRDFYKLINKSKIVLRFGTRFISKPGHEVPEDLGARQFVLSYFMADDSISIFEHPTDGFSGGKFLERSRVPKANGVPGDNFSDRDLFVGARLQINKHSFELYSADEYTLQYMENNLYPMADWSAALNAAKASMHDGGDSLRAAIVEVDSQGSGNLSVEALAEVFERVKVPLTKHQVISIHRRLAKNSGSPEVAVAALVHALGLTDQA